MAVLMIAGRPGPLLAVAMLAACALTTVAAETPDDLLITYEWREGSLPPPYHYAYTFRLEADGAGEVTLVPDYPWADVPVWTEPFAVSRAEVDSLYATMVAQGLLRECWRQSGITLDNA